MRVNKKMRDGTTKYATAGSVEAVQTFSRVFAFQFFFSFLQLWNSLLRKINEKYFSFPITLYLDKGSKYVL